ncbi:MAG: hypothetical protein DI544_12325 [Sphingomonas taxi]|uniref:Phytoene synthase n=1 Tax=Sphingomonas taxi TaxID=1549858 RepID=A0A2W5R6H3_9SPHN|nr:MAG: hypothetical protein DI544_12325 [Sphingomonas taxi]
MPSSDVERALAVRYAPLDAQPGMAALLALDERLGAILRSTREPLIGQMRLTWWHEALAALDTASAPAEPLLQALAQHVVPSIGGAALARLVEGWEPLLEPTLDAAALDEHAGARGSRLFGAMAAVAGMEGAWIADAGRGWALADLARHLSEPAVAAQARRLAREYLPIATNRHWPPRARAIGALVHLARMDIMDAPRPPGHPARTARLLWHRVTGR